MKLPAPTQLLKLAVGAAALAGGYQTSSTIVRSARREDLLGDPMGVIEVDGDTAVLQPRTGQGKQLATYTMGAGAVAAFVGGIYSFTPSAKHVATEGVRVLLRGAGGAGLLAGGIGVIAGAAATSARYDGAEFVRTH